MGFIYYEDKYLWIHVMKEGKTCLRMEGKCQKHVKGKVQLGNDRESMKLGPIGVHDTGT